MVFFVPKKYILQYRGGGIVDLVGSRGLRRRVIFYFLDVWEGFFDNLRKCLKNNTSTVQYPLVTRNNSQKNAAFCKELFYNTPVVFFGMLHACKIALTNQEFSNASIFQQICFPSFTRKWSEKGLLMNFKWVCNSVFFWTFVKKTQGQKLKTQG